MSASDDALVHDEAAGRFTLALDGGVATLDYRVLDTRTWDMTSTFTPPALRGQGAASRLVRGALAEARRQGVQVVPSCWYVDRWIERHPDHEDLRAT